MKHGIKHGQHPGDISKGAKILLFEKERKYQALGLKDTEPSKLRGNRTFIKRILMKERAVLKERFQRELENLD